METASLEDSLYVRGKVAIVTGGTSGLGFCVARRLLQGGAKKIQDMKALYCNKRRQYQSEYNQ